ncbi:MAG: class I SAM-dependent rRNA methyltransferase [Planctomycetes bacterium]|nr:class I SAM-dependent rRNA methyltransferase [Planctomycetota bacterium]
MTAPSAPSATQTATVFVKPRQARPFFGRHPWVLASSVDRVEGPAADGDVVRLVSDRGQFIAHGIYNSHSRIRVRLYDWNESAMLDDAWLAERLRGALALRHNLGLADPAGATRLVSSEADGLSGLIVERFAGHLVVQITSLGMCQRLSKIVALLGELLQPASITVKTDREMNKAEGIVLEDGPIAGTRAEGPVFITEHGVRYGVDLDAGQKTGFYLDQRDNRLAAARLARGRRVLDVCCYTGGFSLAALVAGGAREALGIDSSARAIATAQANAQLNEVTNAHFETGDSFTRLEALAAAESRFGMVVLDPPKFARGPKDVPQALRAYHHLNRLAVAILEPNGWLVTCSCSGSVTREDLMMNLADVARQTGREIQVAESRGAAPDHPVNVACLESEYLKCLVCRVA